MLRVYCQICHPQPGYLYILLGLKYHNSTIDGTLCLFKINALASAQGSKNRGKIAKSPEIRRVLPVPIYYVFDDSEQKVKFKARIKPCSH